MPNNVCAAPCFSAGNASRSTPWLEGCNPPPAKPCNTRDAINISRLLAIPHMAEASVKTVIERRKYLRLPSLTESQPDIGRIIAFAAR